MLWELLEEYIGQFSELNDVLWAIKQRQIKWHWMKFPMLILLNK